MVSYPQSASVNINYNISKNKDFLFLSDLTDFPVVKNWVNSNNSSDLFTEILITLGHF